ncbi:MAG: hypothetical protein K2K25_01320, partial [Muribaculaceae bacterium]|nr:hypothetical protein [Muribaculaceae bacterium]
VSATWRGLLVSWDLGFGGSRGEGDNIASLWCFDNNNNYCGNLGKGARHKYVKKCRIYAKYQLFLSTNLKNPIILIKFAKELQYIY